LATSRESRRYVVAFCRFAAAGIWLRQESLRHILAFPGYDPGTIAVKVTWMERGFNACLNASLHIPIYLQPFLRYSDNISVASIGRKVRYFHTPPLFTAPQGVTPLEFREDLDIHKTKMNGLSCGEESMIMFSRFDTISACDRQTDRRTDGRPAYSYYVARKK